MNSNYPPGAEFDPNAPWNQVDREVEVLVSITMSRVVTVTVSENYTEESLKTAVNDELGEPEKNFPQYDIDDYTVMLN
jgi:hypothetical protein